jgi:hypothetical protein
MDRVTVQWTGPSWLRRPAETLALEKFLTRATGLTLSGPHCDDRAIEHLTKLTRLESLTLSETKISQEGMRRLQRALPDCRVERVGQESLSVLSVSM